MDIPHLVRERLGDESVTTTVSLGDEDLVCVTPTRTLVYRSEGLLSDESVSAYPHDVDRLDVSEGRRKTEFVFEHLDDTDSFTVPSKRADAVLAGLLGGVLRVADVTVDGESVSDAFSFSELTLVVTSHRLVKHVGAPVWDEDFEDFPYDDVTGLSFEKGRHATQVVLSVEGRPRRIKAPSDQARAVEQALTETLFAYHQVDSLADLNEAVGTADPGASADDEEQSLSLDDGITPLVGEDDAPTSVGDTGSEKRATGGASTADDHSKDADHTRSSGKESQAGGETSMAVGSGSTDAAYREGSAGRAVDPEDIEAMKDQLSTLTTAVKKQNQVLRQQQETIDRLIQELRQGR